MGLLGPCAGERILRDVPGDDATFAESDGLPLRWLRVSLAPFRSVWIGGKAGGALCDGDTATGEASSISSSRSGVSDRPSESLKLFSLGIAGEVKLAKIRSLKGPSR